MPRTSIDAGVFDGAVSVGVTGGTSTPIEDLESVARRIYELAGTPEQRAAADELAHVAVTEVAEPAYRSTSLSLGLTCPGRRSARRRSVVAPRHPRRRRRACPWSPSWVAPTWASPRCSTASWASGRAIVEDRARTTRDRLYGVAEWNDRRFVVIDTGGLESRPGDPIEEKVQEQARLAIEEADLIVFVVDAVAGLTPADQEAAELLRRAAAPVIVAINKADNERLELEGAEFHRLGWEDSLRPQRAPRPRYGRPARRDRLGRCRPSPTRSVERKRREADAEELRRPRRGRGLALEPPRRASTRPRARRDRR